MNEMRNRPSQHSDFQQPDPTTTLALSSFANAGIIPAARIPLATNPTNGDSITIGGVAFSFVTSLGSAGAAVQVKLQGSAALTIAKLIEAINGVADVVNWKEATTPFAAAIVADIVSSTTLRIRQATARGGSAVAGISPSITLAASLTQSGEQWNCANLNVAGAATTTRFIAFRSFTVTAAMITNGSYQLELPFTPTQFVVFVRSSSGILRSSSEAVVISGNALSFTMAGSSSPELQSGDIVTVLVSE